MTQAATARVLTSDGGEHTIRVTIVGQTTFHGRTMYRWVPAEPLTGALAKDYTEWTPGALVLPDSRVTLDA